jgi:hypothetical protein
VGFPPPRIPIGALVVSFARNLAHAAAPLATILICSQLTGGFSAPRASKADVRVSPCHGALALISRAPGERIQFGEKRPEGIVRILGLGRAPLVSNPCQLQLCPDQEGFDRRH